MLIRYLLVIEKSYEYYYPEETVELVETEDDVKKAVAWIAADSQINRRIKKTLKTIYKVDLVSGKMKRLEPALENMKIVLKEVN
ncbi:hypothetical protein QNH23_06270 [Siminovitchia fortis]|uniref:Uncharacterized protein n=1 Tax=Siminovitchia fortis TaxID=254758 RepID=A0A443IMK0_9BACI|nr:hypothetical protein [Siminovitchia fortis]RWR06712.1 hypothetical protein D4N35_013680 [Siminovitchia fortis]WHY82976.1 hypothetical protein QNH23_06270 [Siminovitchia fortis]